MGRAAAPSPRLRGEGRGELAIVPERDLVVVHLTVSEEGSFDHAVR
ncbi:MAG TPA: hypothetical protein VMV46_13535 [Thermoanaerobaculia bacterium]|nr:hypothetical protein [Thermoanaerobaculia bacterium]